MAKMYKNGIWEIDQSKLTVNIISIVNNNNKFCVKGRTHIYICTETCTCMQVAV